jgi:hypothetical protein
MRTLVGVVRVVGDRLLAEEDRNASHDRIAVPAAQIATSWSAISEPALRTPQRRRRLLIRAP